MGAPDGLPSGPAVTFLFTDIEGSTRLERTARVRRLGSVVARHDALLRAAIEDHGGVVVKTEGDAFFAAFADAPSAPSRRPSRRSGPSRPRRGTAAWRSGSGWASTSAKAGCARRATRRRRRTTSGST